MDDDDLPWVGSAALLLSAAAFTAGLVGIGAVTAGLAWARWMRC